MKCFGKILLMKHHHCQEHVMKNKRNTWNGPFEETLPLLKDMENIGLQHLHNHETIRKI
jgi:hypothetical protein